MQSTTIPRYLIVVVVAEETFPIRVRRVLLEWQYLTGYIVNPGRSVTSNRLSGERLGIKSMISASTALLQASEVTSLESFTSFTSSFTCSLHLKISLSDLVSISLIVCGHLPEMITAKSSIVGPLFPSMMRIWFITRFHRRGECTPPDEVRMFAFYELILDPHSPIIIRQFNRLSIQCWIVGSTPLDYRPSIKASADTLLKALDMSKKTPKAILHSAPLSLNGAPPSEELFQWTFPSCTQADLVTIG